MAELYEKCLKVGLRMTLPRKIILEVIEAADDHPDVDEMYRRAVEKDRSISIATVYRTIKLFEEAGIIEKLDIGDGRSRYEEAGEHHEHLAMGCKVLHARSNTKRVLPPQKQRRP